MTTCGQILGISRLQGDLYADRYGERPRKARPIEEKPKVYRDGHAGLVWQADFRDFLDARKRADHLQVNGKAPLGPHGRYVVVVAGKVVYDAKTRTYADGQWEHRGIDWAVRRRK